MSRESSRRYRASGKLAKRRKREKGDKVKAKIDRLYPPPPSAEDPDELARIRDRLRSNPYSGREGETDG